MGENSSISWTDDTFSPWIGCAKVSPACDGCYAENLMATRMGRVQWGAPGQGEGTRQRTSASNWAKPLKWEREQAALWAAWDLYCDQLTTSWPVEPRSKPEPRFVFCASLADVFDNAVPVEWRRDLFDLIRATPHLTWLLLTKRPGNILKLWEDVRLTSENVDVDWDGPSRGWPRNAAIGCTVVTQEEADRDIPKLLDAKAVLKPAFAFVSMEPLLGPVELTCLRCSDGGFVDSLNGLTRAPDSRGLLDIGFSGQRLDWVIAGGETDQGSHRARPVHPDWLRSLREQCAAAGTPFHFKQWGEFIPRSTEPGGDLGGDMRAGRAVFVQGDGRDPDGHFRKGDCIMARVGKKTAGRLLDGVTHDARPEVGR